MGMLLCLKGQLPLSIQAQLPRGNSSPPSPGLVLIPFYHVSFLGRVCHSLSNICNQLFSRCAHSVSPGSTCLTPLLFFSYFPSGGSRLPSLQVCPAAYSLRVPKLMPSGKRWRRLPTEWRFAGYSHSLLLSTGTARGALRGSLFVPWSFSESLILSL